MKNTILGAVLMVAAIVALILTGHLNILLAIFMIGLVICFHEFGHFLLARINGVTVKEFSLGLGPRLITWKMRGTRWSLKLFPFGGSCLMLGDEEPLAAMEEKDEDDEEKEASEDSEDTADRSEESDNAAAKAAVLADDEESGTFASKNVWQRISIIFAGPFFNFLLAFLLACIILGSIGYDPAIVTSVNETVAQETGLSVGDTITGYEEHSIVIGRDLALYESLDGVPKTITITYEHDGTSYTKTYDSVYVSRYMCGIGYTDYRDGTVAPMKLTQVVGAAEAAGLKVDDEVIRFNGVEIYTAQDFRAYIEEHPIGADTVEFVVDRKGVELTFKVTPILSEEYQLGFGYNVDYREKVGPLGVVRYGIHEVRYWIKATVKSLVYIFQGKASRKDVGGAVRVVSEMSNVVEESYETDGTFYAFLNLINWAILLSANLGVMNLLPIPALDGGRLLFLIVEAIRGKKANPKVEAAVTLVGFILLMLLMVFILFNDISNVFGG
ncbi:MAG: RIP metalloprotease RseP [Lachnospiraceae bacterium]|nr:RIP metalloprotease RseP [Lachnospiraceae bacterium]